MTTFVLLPPSEGKSEGGDSPWNPGTDALGESRVEVARRLRTFARRVSRLDAEHFFGVRSAHLERARASAVSGLVGSAACPALERYCGVVWEHFDVDSMSSRARRLADSNVQIVSALGGLFRGGEPIPDYRLKMGSRLPTLGKLSAWWRPRLAPIAAERFARHTVVDLLPNEHSAALDPAGIALHTVRVRFRSPSGAAAAGHAAKAAKGLLARSLFERHHDDPVAVCSEFEGAGFVFRDLERTPSVTTVFVAATRRCQR